VLVARGGTKHWMYANPLRARSIGFDGYVMPGRAEQTSGYLAMLPGNAHYKDVGVYRAMLSESGMRRGDSPFLQNHSAGRTAGDGAGRLEPAWDHRTG